MNGWLLDTNVVSELRKTRPNDRVKAWSDGQSSDSFFLSSVTLAEIRFGIERQTEPLFRQELETWFNQRLRPWFAGRILPVDEEVILEWRRMVAWGRDRRITFSQPDLFIAATARVHSLTLCTRNEKDFQGAGVSIVNPWKAHARGGEASMTPDQQLTLALPPPPATGERRHRRQEVAPSGRLRGDGGGRQA